jgi:tRNA(fMet)-specific endonuclease VapC
MIIADTDVLVDFLRGSGAASRVELELSTGNLATTVVAVFELIQGVKDLSGEQAVKSLLSGMALLPLTAESAERAGQIRRQLRKRRQDIGVADSLVAGICLTHAGILLTRNREHFERVADLSLATLSSSS